MAVNLNARKSFSDTFFRIMILMRMYIIMTTGKKKEILMVVMVAISNLINKE